MASNQRSYFRKGDDIDDTDESGSESNEDIPVNVAKKVGGGGKFAVQDSESESEDEQRVVRTEKEKKFDALLTIVTAIHNQLRNNNWVEIQNGAWT